LVGCSHKSSKPNLKSLQTLGLPILHLHLLDLSGRAALMAPANGGRYSVFVSLKHGLNPAIR
jgi:hypothetical protein